MRKRWKWNSKYEGFWIPLAVFGWVPASILGQALTGSLGGGRTGWGFWAVLAAWFGLPILAIACILIARVVVALSADGFGGVLPFSRVAEPVTDDLRTVNH